VPPLSSSRPATISAKSGPRPREGRRGGGQSIVSAISKHVLIAERI